MDRPTPEGRSTRSGSIAAQPRQHRAARTSIAAGAVAALMLAGCGDLKEASLCEDYASFVDAAASVRAIDPSSTTASEAAGAVDRLEDTVGQMRASADGRYGTELANLDDALSALSATLATVPDDSDASVWRPLIEDSLDDAVNAAAVVRERIGSSCSSSEPGT